MARTLLLVDDDKSVRESLCFLLERHGYNVVTAENGAKGIALAGQQVFDGALIDVHMPGMNGILVCRALRELSEKAGRPLAIWMMTGARTTEIIKAATEAGALVVLAKPFDYADLFRRFEAQFGKPEQSSANER
jgi:DNA-binding response OmpR family regulator